MADLILFWHRRDLRLSDNIGLAMARQRSAKVVGIFCFDPAILQAEDIAAVRVDYLLGSLKALKASYQAAGSDLIFLQDNPITALPRLAQALDAKAVFWNWDVEPYAQTRDDAMIKALQEIGIAAHTEWDQLLHTPYDIVSKAKSAPYTVYGPFWKNWATKDKADPYPALQGLEGLSDKQQEIVQKNGAIAIPALQDLGFSWDNGQILEPGETAAQRTLEYFAAKHIEAYDDARNFPAQPGTSTLSPALKFGTIGIRTIWQATIAARTQARSDEAHTGIRTWQQELAWREFYQHVMFHFPELADGPYREHFKNFPWEDNDSHFQAWCAGHTGYPIIDAAMRQLNETGWMHNRCRMIVASFLTKDLILDWRLGEKYFMQHLVDGDLSANNGGWQWSASSGMDPKPLRIFNPASQAKKFDADAEYIRHWIPELRAVETAQLISGVIDASDLARAGYPKPIVDHSVQQREFKARYAAQKAKLTDISASLS
ncbi:deoxyribodipyrimidine photo-lyase [filamentous cyanobacterium LEGE 11480]|uniref:Deoxyribodipyrimidine photo-lyase n=1 Tax=Romeriopsis navalis LEGE 11480 TaxID=2777977 RepID=A0A928VMX1_9CYAN|nr:FAD-binding domain-containing protein [Romeriopsis navalis]MBE9028794.1 deoxyribodipyrimidine photo-lyase [Romeriopsis navalis LEGE 11480]